MAQTPQQRLRNAQFAKDQEARMGKSEDSIKKRNKEVKKASISPTLLYVLVFVVIGGLFFELMSRWLGW